MASLYPSVASIESRLKEINEESKLLKRQLKLSKAYEDGLKAKEGGEAPPVEPVENAGDAS
jgi:hypothetical protein